ncbi:MAG: sulfite exporter TauE/SafE [Arcticibacterium sp.]|jgi:sulfite exporter TauE/SafE
MLWTAFLMGFVGSLHCAGMCGPLTLLLPQDLKRHSQFINGRILYNLGRVLTYTFLGLTIGYLGQNSSLFFSKGLLSVWLGLGILIYLIISRHRRSNSTLYAKVSKLTNSLKTGLKKSLKANYFSGQLFFGILNGLLPCGLVYAALAGAFIQLKPLNGALYMMLFGLGTFPMMLAISLGSGWIKKKFGKQLTNIVPITYAVLATWLIIRGIYTQQPDFHSHGIKAIVNCFVPH